MCQVVFKFEVFREMMNGKITTIQRSELARLIYESLPVDKGSKYTQFKESDKSGLMVSLGWRSVIWKLK